MRDLLMEDPLQFFIQLFVVLVGTGDDIAVLFQLFIGLALRLFQQLIFVSPAYRRTFKISLQIWKQFFSDKEFFRFFINLI